MSSSDNMGAVNEGSATGEGTFILVNKNESDMWEFAVFCVGSGNNVAGSEGWKMKTIKSIIIQKENK